MLIFGVSSMRISLAILFTLVWVPPVSAQETDWSELNVRLSPTISSSEIARLASISEPIRYVSQDGDTLADISSKLYGIKERMREALKNLNPELALEMRRRGKDFLWQPLPPGTEVHLPALSKLVKNVSVEVTEENDTAIRAKILAWAKSFYWQVGPITLGAIKKANPFFFVSDAREAAEEEVPKKGTKKTSAVLPSVPTFHTLKIRKEKESEAANVLASLTNSGVASGGIFKPSFLETDDVLSPCAASEDQTENWFGQAVHADQVTISKLNLTKIKIAILDSGIDYEHDAFKNDLWDGGVAEDDDLNRKLPQTVGIDFTGPAKSNDIRDLSPISHGTHVSGIASGAAIARVLRAFQV